MIDHVSKRKQAQSSHNLGRHWGIIGREQFRQLDIQTRAIPDGQTAVWVERILRRMTRRRVPDKRSRHGIPFQTLTFDRATGKPYDTGDWFVCGFMGGKVVTGWDGNGQPDLRDLRDIAQAMGKAKRNVWTLRKARSRANPAGQHFGRDFDRLLKAAITIKNNAGITV